MKLDCGYVFVCLGDGASSIFVPLIAIKCIEEGGGNDINLYFKEGYENYGEGLKKRTIFGINAKQAANKINEAIASVIKKMMGMHKHPHFPLQILGFIV